jgi:4-amino-4-deoxy-L-arabinose transferase-like glycosyltransferase
MARHIEKAIKLPQAVIPWQRVILAGIVCGACLLVFYRLGAAPRTWHDEGGALSLAKTLAEDGVYGVKSSDGYQTFGAVQSVGPTVILPIAISYKLFGAGVLQGRAVTAVFGLLALGLIYAMSTELFGHRTGLVAALLVLGSGGIFLHNSRMSVAEVPATTFFLAGCMVLMRAVPSRRISLYLVAGALMGLAMVTKTQFVLMGFGALALLIVLDRLYYKQAAVVGLVAMGGVAAVCFTAWQIWQVAYFGPALFWENAAKLRLLAGSTTGFHTRWTKAALQYLFGTDSDHFYFFWGFPALVYAGLLSKQRNRDGLIVAFLVSFAILWMAYFVFYQVPFFMYVLTPILITSTFVAKLWHDLTDGFRVSWRSLSLEWKASRVGQASATFAAVLVLALMIIEPLQKAAREDMLLTDASQPAVAQYINASIPHDATIETWERELAVLADHRYHFPDQSILASTHGTVYLGKPYNYALGAPYFQKYRPAYLIIGQYASSSGLYDMQYVANAGCLLTTIDTGTSKYDIYKLVELSAPNSNPLGKPVARCS